MILYLTYNDLPSGIYQSQVMDLVSFFQYELKTNIRLLAFISLRNFFSNRKKIKNQMPDAIVLPMWPGIANWNKNYFLLKLVCLFIKPDKIMARSVLATQLALKTDCKTIYDGRGAIAAEWKEYDVITNESLKKQILQLEKDCVLKSDFRIAVSKALIEYWKNEFDYGGNNDVVIPCTLNKIYENCSFNESLFKATRDKLKIKEEDCLLVYAGSLAGWQSLNLLQKQLDHYLNQSATTKIMFLSEKHSFIQTLQINFPERILHKTLNPNEVPYYLMAGDYGLLIREDSITNKVASPVKFAEYLACGLKVIISENLGDYSQLVKENKLGFIHTEPIHFNPLSLAEKHHTRQFALSHFTKNNYMNEYTKVINC